MKIIQNPNIIKYRIALQNERDHILDDLRLHIQEVYERATKNKAENKSLFDEENLRFLYDLIFKVAGPHLELQFGSLWHNQTSATQAKIIQEVTRQVVNEMKSQDEDFIEFPKTRTLLMIDDVCLKLTDPTNQNG